jgi:hypothetical protein
MSPLVYVDDVNILSGSIYTINKTDALVVVIKKGWTGSKFC